MYFSLVSTVFNEKNRFDQTLNDLHNQTLQPSEIIITDAGSTDGTYEMLLDWKAKSPIPVTILQKHKCNVAEGRNLAIKAAKYDLIASMDFGCRFHKEWLASIITPFNEGDVEITGGSYTVEESEQTTVAAKAAYVISKGYNTNVNAPGFIPSSRSIAYKKSVFDKIGGYCEWLTLAGDDMVFGLEAVAKNYKFHVVDKRFVFWGRHKIAPAFAKEAFRYGLGEGEARIRSQEFFKHLITLVMQACFVVFALIIAGEIILGKSVPGYLIALCVISALSFKSFISLITYWFSIKSGKYDVQSLLYSFYLLTRIRAGYVKGWYNGYFFSSAEQKRQAELLKNRLQNK